MLPVPCEDISCPRPSPSCITEGQRLCFLRQGVATSLQGLREKKSLINCNDWKRDKQRERQELKAARAMTLIKDQDPFTYLPTASYKTPGERWRYSADCNLKLKRFYGVLRQ